MSMIHDGRSGNTAHVSKEGLLRVAAESRRVIALASEIEKAFSASSGFLAVTGGEKGVLKVAFSTVEEAHIDRIVLQSDVSVKWRIYNAATSDTFTVSGSSVNLDAGSTVRLNGSVRKGDNTATITGGTLIFSGFTNANQSLDLNMDGALHFTANSNLYITAEGDGNVVATVMFYEFCLDDY